jgi:translation initiation factor 3 subunit F
MHSVYIHDYYSRSDPQAIFLTVDTSLRNGHLEVKTYTRSKVGLPGKTEGIIFTPIPCEVVYFEPEKVGVKMLGRTVGGDPAVSVISNFDQIEK